MITTILKFQIWHWVTEALQNYHWDKTAAQTLKKQLN